MGEGILYKGGWLFRQQEQVPPDLKDSVIPDGNLLSTIKLYNLLWLHYYKDNLLQATENVI